MKRKLLQQKNIRKILTLPSLSPVVLYAKEGARKDKEGKGLDFYF
jgi:hypothetical protein